eukprot:TRINITY_DN4223_c0_g2_i22.p3 TRINITY_DN4223_c0_g2~~TRINITY_DN4223_c0_g2_i22.p3  ORF type:complete len:117 (+),score=22.47 TRINITY_DN4223_c0_g2_i22:1162-1512(+)
MFCCAATSSDLTAADMWMQMGAQIGAQGFAVLTDVGSSQFPTLGCARMGVSHGAALKSLAVLRQVGSSQLPTLCFVWMGALHGTAVHCFAVPRQDEGPQLPTLRHCLEMLLLCVLV